MAAVRRGRAAARAAGDVATAVTPRGRVAARARIRIFQCTSISIQNRRGTRPPSPSFGCPRPPSPSFGCRRCNARGRTAGDVATAVAPGGCAAVRARIQIFRWTSIRKCGGTPPPPPALGAGAATCASTPPPLRREDARPLAPQSSPFLSRFDRLRPSVALAATSAPPAMSPSVGMETLSNRAAAADRATAAAAAAADIRTADDIAAGARGRGRCRRRCRGRCRGRRRGRPHTGAVAASASGEVRAG